MHASLASAASECPARRHRRALIGFIIAAALDGGERQQLLEIVPLDCAHHDTPASSRPRLAYSNNLKKIETIRDDGLIEGANPTIAALTGRIDVRFADTTLIDLAAGGTPVLSAMAKLALTAHEVYLPKPRLGSRAPAACRRASTSGARRTMSRAGC